MVSSFFLVCIFETLLLSSISSENVSTGDEKYEKIFKELNDLRHTTTFLVQQNKLLQLKLAKVEENDSARCEKSRKRFASVDFLSVFFTVENNNDMSLGDNQVIAFDHVVSNEGSGYDTSNGIFTAPTNGVYVFHVQIRGNEDHTCLVDIVKKENRLISIWVTSNTSDSSMAVVRLNNGDKIWIRNRHFDSRSCVLDDLSSFSGFLLYQ
ncbi:Hypothetical predicted protein [Mytilus galloprovincialis]|uniref:C1q domain-containing protein n=1 Tax=Mytilus galloprovincialis TaxID=29158 RepID=A0A8B6EDS3_MYTGA|nr:Hypothetical predicted protein [Mytilus galloprovincialis]